MFSPFAFIRLVLWRIRGARIDRGTEIPAGTIATWPHQVELGKNCILQRGIFFNYDHFWTAGPSIRIGHRVFIGRGVEFNIQGGIDIGDDCLIASGCFFVDHDHGMLPDTNMNQQPTVVRPIRICKNVWIGAKSIILKGVTIGEGSVIGAGSIVTKDIPSGEMWFGNPARFQKIFSENVANQFR